MKVVVPKKARESQARESLSGKGLRARSSADSADAESTGTVGRPVALSKPKAKKTRVPKDAANTSEATTRSLRRSGHYPAVPQAIPGNTGPVMFFLLWLAAVGSALGVVSSTYEARKSTQALEKLRSEASLLQVTSGKYLLEKSSLSAYSRIESLATKKLNMVIPDPENTVMVYRK